MNKIKLLPCPFCGGIAHMSHAKIRTMKMVEIMCLSCKVKREDAGSTIEDWDNLEKIAAENWNSRVI